MEEEGMIEYIGSTIGKGVTFWRYNHIRIASEA